MTTPVSICNSALTKLGVERINSFSEQSKAARLCNEQYLKIKNETLEGHYWNFAMKEAEFALLLITPLFNFRFAYQIPADCLRVRTMREPETRFKVKKGVLYTNADVAVVEFITSAVDESDMSPQFREALAWAMAVDLSYSLVQSVSLSERINKKADIKMRDARSSDGQEGVQDQLEVDEWLDSRLTSGTRVGNVEV